MGPLILREHQWRLHFEVMLGAVAETPGELRRLSGIDDPKIPDDVFSATAATAATTSAALLEILDSGCFVAAPCICCYSVRSAEHMREASSALRLFCRYYSSASFAGHRDYGRAVLTLARDLLPIEVAKVQKWLARQNSTPEVLRAIHRLERGLCVAVPACRPRTLWIYSTPDGRRLLRHLARSLPRALGVLSVSVASSSADSLPRFRFRMYAATLRNESGSPQSEGPNMHAELLCSVLAWAEKRRAKHTKSRKE